MAEARVQLRYPEKGERPFRYHRTVDETEGREDSVCAVVSVRNRVGVKCNYKRKRPINSITNQNQVYSHTIQTCENAFRCMILKHVKRFIRKGKLSDGE